MKPITIPEINPFIIGAGGVASYLLPVLIKTFPIPNLWLRDADKLEERNLDRQLFSPDQIGQFKAEALILNSQDRILGNNKGSVSTKAWSTEETEPDNAHDQRHTRIGTPASERAPNEVPHEHRWQAQTTWFTEGEIPPDKADLIICVADNHTARRAALEACESADIPCIIGGNEYYDSQALWVDPKDLNTPRDPRERYKEIATDTSQDPIRCQGEEQITHPQLAIANFRCASHIMDMLWMHKVILPQIMSSGLDSVKNFPIEIFTSINNCEYIRHG